MRVTTLCMERWGQCVPPTLQSSCISTNTVYNTSSVTWLTLMPVRSDIEIKVFLMSGRMVSLKGPPIVFYAHSLSKPQYSHRSRLIACWAVAQLSVTAVSPAFDCASREHRAGMIFSGRNGGGCAEDAQIDSFIYWITSHYKNKCHRNGDVINMYGLFHKFFFCSFSN